MYTHVHICVYTCIYTYIFKYVYILTHSLCLSVFLSVFVSSLPPFFDFSLPNTNTNPHCLSSLCMLATRMLSLSWAPLRLQKDRRSFARKPCRWKRWWKYLKIDVCMCIYACVCLRVSACVCL